MSSLKKPRNNVALYYLVHVVSFFFLRCVEGYRSRTRSQGWPCCLLVAQGLLLCTSSRYPPFYAHLPHLDVMVDFSKGSCPRVQKIWLSPTFTSGSTPGPHQPKPNPLPDGPSWPVHTPLSYRLFTASDLFYSHAYALQVLLSTVQSLVEDSASLFSAYKLSALTH